ncbi:hypothetical protein JHK85_017706 [Glycine max]|nr:hypothetical protein JHK85_017706 [Glycine max]
MNGTFVSGYTLRDHTTTKDSPSLKKERDAHYLRGLLPPTEYAELLHEFMNAVKQNYGERILVQAGTGIAELIALETSKRGLIVSSRKESLQHFKKPWAHEHEPVKELVNVVKQIKPTVLIGTSGQGRTFTKDVVEAMASINEVTQEDYDKGLIYPPFSNIRKKISAHIAANVAAKAYELGEPEFSFNSLATRLPQPKDLVKFAESSVYSPVYRGYR